MARYSARQETVWKGNGKALCSNGVTSRLQKDNGIVDTKLSNKTTKKQT